VLVLKWSSDRMCVDFFFRRALLLKAGRVGEDFASLESLSRDGECELIVPPFFSRWLFKMSNIISCFYSSLSCPL